MTIDRASEPGEHGDLDPTKGQRRANIGKVALISTACSTPAVLGVAFLATESAGLGWKILGGALVAIGAVGAIAPPVHYFMGDGDFSPHRLPPQVGEPEAG